MADDKAAIKLSIQFDAETAKKDAKKIIADIKGLAKDEKIKLDLSTNVDELNKTKKQAQKTAKEIQTALGTAFTIKGKGSQQFLNNYGNQLEALKRRLDALAVRAEDASKKSFVNKKEAQNVKVVQDSIKGLQQQCDAFLTGAEKIDEFKFFNLKQGVGLLGTSLTSSISSSSKQLSTAGVEFQKLGARIATANIQLEKLQQNNPKASGLLEKGKIKELADEYINLVNAAEKIEQSALADGRGFLNSSEIAQANKYLTTASQVLTRLISELKLAGGAGDTFWSSMLKNASKYLQFTLVTKAVQMLGTMFASVVDNVRELDSAMVELRKVTDETAATYEKFLDNAASKAGSLATTVTDLTKTTAEFAKLGYSISEAFELAQTATMYSNVGDLDVSDATKNLVSIMKSFNIEAKDSIQIVDMLNEVGNNFAISSGGLGEAMEDSASALRAAGNSLGESMAMVTAMNEIMQDTSKTSTALRTISARLRNTSVELEAMGEDAEGAASTMSVLRREVKSLSGVDIMSDDNTYKSTYQILRELSDEWSNLSDSQQAALTRLIAGTRQFSAFNAILTNFGQAEKALEATLESSGSAAKENERYIDSINGKLATLDSAVQTFSNNLLNSDLYKFIVDIGIASVKTADSLGALSTVVGVASTVFLILAKKSTLEGISAGLVKIIGASNIASTALTTLAGAATATKIALSALAGFGLAAVVSVLSFGWDKLSKWIDDLNITLEEHLDLIKDAKSVYEEQADKVEKLASRVEELRNILDGIDDGSIKLADDQSIKGLERELELQQMLLKIEEDRAKAKRDELDKEAINTLDDSGRAYRETGFNSNVYMVSGNTGVSIIEEHVSLHEQYQNELAETKRLHDEWQNAVVKASSNGATEEDIDNMKKAQENYDTMRSKMEGTLATIIDVTGEISEGSEGYVKYNTELDKCIKAHDDFKISIGDVEGALKYTNKTTEQSIVKAGNLSSVLEEIENATSLLSNAQEEMNESGSLQLDTVKELIDAGKTELLYLDEKTGAIKLNTAALKAETLATIANELAEVNSAITTNELVISSLKAEAMQRALTTEEIKRQIEAAEQLDLLYKNKEVLTGTYKSIETDAYLNKKKSGSSTYSNEQLEHYLKQLAHAKALNKYHNKEQDYIQKLLYAYTKLCKTLDERQEIEQMIYDAQQEYNSRLLSQYEEQQGALETMIDYAIKIVKKEKEEEIDAINKVTEAYREQYEMRKKALQEQQDDEQYTRELVKKQKAVTDIEAKLIALQFDDSTEATKRRLQLEEELVKAKEELEEYQRDRYFEEQEKALDEEMDRFEESQQDKIDVIEDYLSDEQRIRKDAIAMMEKDYIAFYKKLEEYCNQYEGYVSEEIKDAWANAKTALDAFDNSQLKVLGTLEDLIAKQKELSKVLEAQYYTTEEYKGSGGSGGNGNANITTAKGSYYTQESTKDKYKKNVSGVLARFSMAESLSDFNHAKDDILAYIKSIQSILDMPALKELPNNDPIKSVYLDLLAHLKDAYQATYRGYLSGGVVDQYGMAMLHGDKRHSEVVFSSEDAKKLWSLIHNIPEFHTDRPNNLGANNNQEISIGEVMPVTIESGAIVTDEVLGELRNIATQVKREFVDSLSKTGYRANLASRRL